MAIQSPFESPSILPTRRGVYLSRDFAAAATLLAISMLVPTAVFFVARTSSQAVGVALASVMIVTLAILGHTRGARNIDWAKTLFLTFVVAGVVLIHALIASLFEPVDFGRAISSVALAMTLAMGASGLSRSLFMLDSESTSNAVTFMLAVLLVAGAASVAGLQPPSSTAYFKSVFPFTEPSHYALTLVPILLAFSVNQRATIRLMILAGCLGMAYHLQSLSLVVGVLLIATITLPTLWLGAAGLAVVALVGVLDLEYFTTRLDLSTSNGNLSALVYLQGWDLANQSILRTYGWGVGFQQMGVGSITTYTSSLITALAGTDVNLRDGGFTLAKVLAEFGVLGGLVMTAYTFVAIRCAWTLRQIAMRTRPATAGMILALAFVCGSSVEVFVRGLGYFSGTMLLLLAALVFLGITRGRVRR